MRVLICGDRKWSRGLMMETFICGLKHIYGDDLHIIEGEARGADQMAANIAKFLIPSENIHKFPANWDKFGKAAGPIRNQQMLDEGKPDLIVAFHDDIKNSKGTRDMIARAEKAGVSWSVIGKNL